MTMEWKQLTPEEKLNRLSQQLEDIQRTRALIERFEQLTQKWLKRVQATKKEA
jgi:myo-inositol catabolism protein IolC